MEVRVLSPDDPTWNTRIDQIGRLLDAPNNRHLFPYHFLQVALPRIGGHLVLARQADRYVGAGFLVPRADGYTLRFHPLEPLNPSEQQQLVATTSVAAGEPNIVFYDVNGTPTFQASSSQYGDVNIGRPSSEEAILVRDLYRQIWGSPEEYLYPADIHSSEFCLGTSLVARVEDQVAGFLFGFHKRGVSALPADWQNKFSGQRRLESQTMGVLPAYRGMRIGFLLKQAQAAAAREVGIHLINWTVDPLQFPNAALNFGLLRAFAVEFHPDLYPFRNELNRVHASRFSLTWLVSTKRVREVPLYEARATVIDVAHREDIPRVNRSWTDANYTLTDPMIAIEVPSDWTALQEENLVEAKYWRETTDRIFAHYVGIEQGRYAITGVGTDGDLRFLIGERNGPQLWENLGYVEEG